MSVIHRVEQGSYEWLMLRLGIPTASRFSDIVTPKKLEPATGKTPKKYMADLLTEWALQRPLEDASSFWMDRGGQVEPQAIAKYELLRDVEVDRVGFVVSDDGLIGCSPDGLIGDDGDVEVKCPAAATHMNYWLNGIGDEYACQMQGRLMIHGRRWCDFFSWHPDLPPVLIRFARDEAMIAALRKHIYVFAGSLADKKADLLATGYKLPEPYHLVAARAQDPVSTGGVTDRGLVP